MTPPAPGSSARRSEFLAVYGIGLFQGLSLVAFPAAATILTASTGYGLSKSQYGLLFLPQVILAIAGSLALPALARRFTLKRVLIAGLGANTLAMSLLVASDAVRSDAAAYPILLVATTSLGLGFGLTLGAISTYAGAFMPDRRDVALTALNVLLGLGTALSPLLIAIFTDVGQWWYLPLLAAAGLIVLIGVALRQPLIAPEARAATATGTGRSPGLPRLFWWFAAVLVLYGIAETMFGNWGTTLLVERGVKATLANDALAAFWASVTVGRLLIAVGARRIGSTRIYLVLPWVITLALFVTPFASSAAAGIALFALGGFACSGFFPMTVGYGEATFPTMVELAAGWLIAAYQLGYGLAAFGGGALQNAISLTTLFRVVAVLSIVMGVLAVPVARRQHPRAARPNAAVPTS